MRKNITNSFNALNNASIKDLNFSKVLEQIYLSLEIKLKKIKLKI